MWAARRIAITGKVRAMAILRKVVTGTGIVAGLGLAFALGRSSNSEESKERRWRRFFWYAANPDEVVDSFARTSHFLHSNPNQSVSLIIYALTRGTT